MRTAGICAAVGILIGQTAWGQADFRSILEVQRARFGHLDTVEFTGEMISRLGDRLIDPEVRPDPATRHTFRYCYDGSRFRVDQHPSDSGMGLRAAAFGGSRYEWTSPSDRLLNMSASPAFGDNPELGPSPLVYPYLWSVMRGDENSFRGRLSPAAWDADDFRVTSSSLADWHGRPVFEFVLVRAREHPGISEVRVHFDPSLAYYPVHHATLASDERGGVRTVTEVEVLTTTSHTVSSNEVHLPSHLVHRQFASNGDVLLETELLMDLASVRINEAIEPAVFNLAAELQGYRHYDFDSGKFVGGGVAPEEWNRQRAAANVPDHEFEVRPSPPAADARALRSRLFWGGIGIAMILVTGAIVSHVLRH